MNSSLVTVEVWKCAGPAINSWSLKQIWVCSALSLSLSFFVPPSLQLQSVSSLLPPLSSSSTLGSSVFKLSLKETYLPASPTTVNKPCLCLELEPGLIVTFPSCVAAGRVSVRAQWKGERVRRVRPGPPPVLLLLLLLSPGQTDKTLPRRQTHIPGWRICVPPLRR